MCVRGRICPASNGSTTYSPQILVVPVSVSGMSNTGSTEVYPLQSFTAKATGEGTSEKPADLASSGPAACSNDTSLTSTDCYQDQDASSGAQSNKMTSGKYWRACLYATTSMGDVTWNVNTGKFAVVMAITRCAPSAESTGSGFTVWAH